MVYQRHVGGFLVFPAGGVWFSEIFTIHQGCAKGWDPVLLFQKGHIEEQFNDLETFFWRSINLSD
jgi:hypothetical protein